MFFKILLLFIKICTWDPDRNVRLGSKYQVNQKKKKNVFAPKVDIRSFYIKLQKVPKKYLSMRFALICNLLLVCKPALQGRILTWFFSKRSASFFSSALVKYFCVAGDADVEGTGSGSSSTLAAASAAAASFLRSLKNYATSSLSLFE